MGAAAPEEHSVHPAPSPLLCALFTLTGTEGALSAVNLPLFRVLLLRRQAAPLTLSFRPCSRASMVSFLPLEPPQRKTDQ